MSALVCADCGLEGTGVIYSGVAERALCGSCFARAVPREPESAVIGHAPERSWRRLPEAGGVEHVHGPREHRNHV